MINHLTMHTDFHLYPFPKCQTYSSFKVGTYVYWDLVTLLNHIRLFTPVMLTWFPDIPELFIE